MKQQVSPVAHVGCHIMKDKITFKQKMKLRKASSRNSEQKSRGTRLKKSENHKTNLPKYPVSSYK